MKTSTGNTIETGAFESAPFSVPTSRRAGNQVAKTELKRHYSAMYGGMKFNYYPGIVGLDGRTFPAADRRADIFHNHPWEYLYLHILQGGYKERRLDSSTLEVTDHVRDAGTIHHLAFEDFHYIYDIIPHTVSVMILGPLATHKGDTGWWGYINEYTGEWYKFDDEFYSDPNFGKDLGALKESGMGASSVEEFIEITRTQGVDISKWMPRD